MITLTIILKTLSRKYNQDMHDSSMIGFIFNVFNFNFSSWQWICVRLSYSVWFSKNYSNTKLLNVFYSPRKLFSISSKKLEPKNIHGNLGQESVRFWVKRKEELRCRTKLFVSFMFWWKCLQHVTCLKGIQICWLGSFVRKIYIMQIPIHLRFICVFLRQPVSKGDQKFFGIQSCVSKPNRRGIGITIISWSFAS